MEPKHYFVVGSMGLVDSGFSREHAAIEMSRQQHGLVVPSVGDRSNVTGSVRGWS